MTYSHAIDFAICQAVMERGGFAYLGLIASKTKRARLARRLREFGVPDATIAKPHAPFGLLGLAFSGMTQKSPTVNGASFAGDLLQRPSQASAMKSLDCAP